MTKHNAAQLDMLAATFEDLPLFSGVAVRAQEEVFTPPTVATIVLRKETHPLITGASIYRAYRLYEDGEMFPLYLASEDVEECKRRVRADITHLPLSFQVVSNFSEVVK